MEHHHMTTSIRERGQCSSRPADHLLSIPPRPLTTLTEIRKTSFSTLEFYPWITIWMMWKTCHDEGNTFATSWVAVLSLSFTPVAGTHRYSRLRTSTRSDTGRSSLRLNNAVVASSGAAALARFASEQLSICSCVQDADRPVEAIRANRWNFTWKCTRCLASPFYPKKNWKKKKNKVPHSACKQNAHRRAPY